MKDRYRLALYTVVGLIVLCITAISFLLYYPNAWTRHPEMKTITVGENATGAEIADTLYQEGLIRSPLWFRMALRLVGDKDVLQRGHYEISTKSTPMDVIRTLQHGTAKEIQVTIPEGFTVKQIAERLQAKHLVSADEFLAAAKTYRPYEYMKGSAPTDYAVEGFLFPDTYRIPVGASATDILHLMTAETDAKLTPAMRKEIQAQGMTIYQFMTLASLVEKEAKLDEDRPKIAAAFRKRLTIDMPLQSCASIQYILGYPKPMLSVEDTQLPSPYNTYLHPALPPGPIANPGVKSMEAVLHAPPTDDIYFVADQEGRHHFSKTYEEHLKVVKQIYGS